MAALKTKSHGYDLEATFKWLRGKAHPTVRLHPRVADALLANASKVGGDVLWPGDEAWPRCEAHQSDYVPVLQLRSVDLPGIEFQSQTDLLQVLWCPNDHEDNGWCPALQVFWRNAVALVPYAVAQLRVQSSGGEYLPRQCCVSPEIVQEYPHAASLTAAQLEALKMWELDKCEMDGAELYQYLLSVAPGFKVGGYPNWSQDPQVPVCSCRRKMDYLLTIDSAECDGGTFERWLPVADQHVWQAPFAVRDQVQRAAGLMLGDMGAINVFVCKNCSPWQHRWVFQCS